jgi:hypothetical protein
MSKPVETISHTSSVPSIGVGTIIMCGPRLAGRRHLIGWLWIMCATAIIFAPECVMLFVLRLSPADASSFALPSSTS